MYEIFVSACVSRPQYALLARGYNDYLVNSRPCQRGATNQCAVRMSIALGRAGFGLESFHPQNRVHSGNGHCQTNGVKHVLGANELAQFLSRDMASPSRIQPGAGQRGCQNAFQEIRGRRGIVYFNNCFTHQGATRQTGDHIDLFDGEQYFNQIIHPRAGGDETTGELVPARR